MKVLIIASALIPIYVIYMSIIGTIPLQISIFASIYSIMIIVLWVLYYLDFFDKINIFKKSNNNIQIKNEVNAAGIIKRLCFGF